MKDRETGEERSEYRALLGAGFLEFICTAKVLAPKSEQENSTFKDLSFRGEEWGLPKARII